MKKTILGIVAAATLAVPLAMTPAVHADNGRTRATQSIVYDALGDSYAAGHGAAPGSAYAVQLDGRVNITLDNLVATVGATVPSLLASGQLNALDENTDLVTISIGGNDVGWGTAVAATLGGTDIQAAQALALTTHKVSNQLPGLLDQVYGEISLRAPDARVLVTGYPRLFSTGYGPYYAASPAELQALNDGADLLNGVIAAAAARHGYQFVDVTKRFIDHGANSADPWLHGPSSILVAFHPNEAGYEAYTAAVTATIKPGQF